MDVQFLLDNRSVTMYVRLLLSVMLLCNYIKVKGDVVRIGRATIKCSKDKVNVTDICTDMARISRSDRSTFYLSDNVNKKNTSRAWEIVSRGAGNPFLAETVEKEIVFVYSLHTLCKATPDGRFEARAIQFWGQYIKHVMVKFCDTSHPLQSNMLYCDSRSNGLTDWADPEKGELIYNTPKDPDVATEFLINKWFVVTGVRIRVVASKPRTNPIKIWGFNIYACCDASQTKHDARLPEVLSSPEPTFLPHPSTVIPIAPRVTGHICTNLFILQSSTIKRQFGQGKLVFNDRDESRDENLALHGSSDVYIGEKGKTVTFYIAFKDGKSFEYWQVCGQYLNIQRITYIMKTSDVTYIQSKTFCGINAWQRSCYMPRGEGIFVKKGMVKFEVVPGRRAHIKGFKLEGCRDHFKYQYYLHTNPCDYKALVLETPRNEAISIYALKAKIGNWLQTEMYHFTDRTGNDGDNTWFTLEPKHHLVSAIWTENTYIGLNWNIKKSAVTIDIQINGEATTMHYVTTLDIPELDGLDGKDVDTPAKKAFKDCLAINFKPQRCKNSEPLLATAEAKGNRKVKLVARAHGKGYRFLLPTESHNSNHQKRCRSAERTKKRECKKQAVLNRVQHDMICDRIKETMTRGAEVPGILEVSTVYQSCLFAYKTLRWTCESMAGRPSPDQRTFFQIACTSGTGFATVDRAKAFVGTSVVEMMAEGRDPSGRRYRTNPRTASVDITGSDLNLVAQTSEGDFAITGLTTVPKTLRASHKTAYTVCVEYKCPSGALNEYLLVTCEQARVSKTCRKLAKAESCCVEMPPRMNPKQDDVIVMLYYTGDEVPVIYKEETVTIVSK